jgi:mono/diheme cytochrome c family protein
MTKECRMANPLRLIPSTVLLAATISTPGSAAEPGKVNFARDVRPILAENCFECHGPDPRARKGDLRLDVPDDLFADRGGPRLIERGRPGASELIARITAAEADRRMPPAKSKHQLTAKQIETLRRWVTDGAPWGEHWAFVAPVRPPLPQVENPSWCRNPIDRFVLAKLQAAGLKPAPEADRVTLVRRLHLDLVGLPPTPAEVDAFLADDRPDAYDRLVDRLLASPHFGERWGRHWLDLARYADSDGYEDDLYRPDAWRFRDWVIAAVNADRPYDRFTIEQLAGDLLPDAGYEQKAATGFHRMAVTNGIAAGRELAEEFRVKTAKDWTNTTATVWLGLTLGCAECHTHKYDPIPQRDYYRFYAFFDNTAEAKVSAPPLPERYTAAYQEAVREFEAYRKAAGLNSEEAKNNRPQPPSTQALALAENPTPRRTFVHVRGDFRTPGEEVTPGTPAALQSPPVATGGLLTRLTRLDLARWIADPRNPLTGRVAVNHLWQHLFGRGLVATPENFGVQGEPPSHPELLDWLAVEFVATGWSRKQLIRRIVTSATYRQSSRHRPELAEVDPGNALLGRQNRFRVEGEVVRDLGLSAAGLLNLEVGGPCIQPPLPGSLTARKELRSERVMLPSRGPDRHRRGVYVNVQRTLAYPMLKDFDAADPSAACTRRERSVTPQQALALLNDPVFVECARGLGLRLAGADRGGRDDRIAHAFRLCLARPPSPSEAGILAEVYETHRKLYGADPQSAADVLGGERPPDGVTAASAAAWTAVARTLLNLDEFITRE